MTQAVGGKEFIHCIFSLGLKPCLTKRYIYPLRYQFFNDLSIPLQSYHYRTLLHLFCTDIFSVLAPVSEYFVPFFP